MKHVFDKFINQEKNSKKKEAFKQEKRKWKDEKRKKYEEGRSQKAEGERYGVVGKQYESNAKYPTSKTQQPGNRNIKVAGKATEASKLKTDNHNEIPLNKFIAHAGICGRREAAELVKEGKVKVNNDVIYEPGFKVTSSDKVVFNNKQ